jgi:hypothetical protein
MTLKLLYSEFPSTVYEESQFDFFHQCTVPVRYEGETVPRLKGDLCSVHDRACKT